MTASDDKLHPPFQISHPHLAEFSCFLPELNKESDRGRVMVSYSFLDELMRRILLAFFIDRESSQQLLDGFNARLGTFSTRTAAAYTLGLISQAEFKACETLRRVRNRFAHDVHASFDQQDIRDLCRNLTKA
jgi:mannitol operon repressor